MDDGHLEKLLVDMKESLEREMQRGFEMMAARFDDQDARLGRHAGLLQTGNRWTVRMNDWAEKIDSAIAVKDKQIAELSERVAKLEKANGHSKQT